MEQNEITDIISEVTNRDWLYYKKEIGNDLADLDFLSILIIIADQKYKKETGRHNMNCYLDMTLTQLKDHLDIASEDESAA